MAFLRSSRAQVSDPEAVGLLDEKIAALQAQQDQHWQPFLLEKPQDSVLPVPPLCQPRPARPASWWGLRFPSAPPN